MERMKPERWKEHVRSLKIRTNKTYEEHVEGAECVELVVGVRRGRASSEREENGKIGLT